MNSYNVVMDSISMGEISELVGHISSMEHINKVQLSENIKTSTIDYNNTSYNGYFLEDVNQRGGSLINLDNELCGVYLSNINSFIETKLIKEIVYSIYSLIL